MFFCFPVFLFIGLFFLNWSIIDFSIALVSDIQQSDSAVYVYIHTHILFQSLFHYK